MPNGSKWLILSIFWMWTKMYRYWLFATEVGMTHDQTTNLFPCVSQFRMTWWLLWTNQAFRRTQRQKSKAPSKSNGYDVTKSEVFLSHPPLNPIASPLNPIAPPYSAICEATPILHHQIHLYWPSGNLTISNIAIEQTRYQHYFFLNCRSLAIEELK